MNLIKVITLFFILSTLQPLFPVMANEQETISDSSQIQPLKINLNTADLIMLTQLPGIGEKKAQAILDKRLELGEFNNLDDLLLVKGIGPKLVDKLRGVVEL
ncbi:ComEA family DNA-binding protein [Pseudoalteromonas xiamenensis]|uniref:ComEA family DNA-binding protein n=1 Tax=Pseudoalteromonas xiamenensis TaxID=882626 RepID=UPI0027E51C7B|nr:ComEA family DNA-binding protein [Pseudoalteromonas xiamenensis]WMN60402.1 ComEA family DNA-binding protein [Pseudoalteromonas xiamenensis]